MTNGIETVTFILYLEICRKQQYKVLLDDQDALAVTWAVDSRKGKLLLSGLQVGNK